MSTPIPSIGSSLPDRRQDRLTSRTMANLERQTLVRMASVQAEGLVQAEKLAEVDHLAMRTMTGQAMLRRSADALAAGDPFLADELKLIGDMARAGKVEILADTFNRFSREGRL